MTTANTQTTASTKVATCAQIKRVGSNGVKMLILGGAGAR